MSEKYAVYVLMVEDTEEEDMRVADLGYDYARLAGNMTYGEASDLVNATPVENYEKADA